MSSKTRRNRERRHRRMDENRDLYDKLTLQLNEVEDEKERERLQIRRRQAFERSSRSANKL